MSIASAPYFWDTPVGPGAIHRQASTLTVALLDQQGTDQTQLILALSPGDGLRLTAQDGRWWTYLVSTAATLTPEQVATLGVTSGPQSQHLAPVAGDLLTVTVWDADGVEDTTPAPHTTGAAATVDDALALWPDADTMPVDTLTDLLDTAWEACAAFLPAEQLDPAPTTVPRRWVQANVLHARDLWTAYRRDNGDVLGFDTYAVRVRPLSSTVRALLRPPAGVPGVA